MLSCKLQCLRVRLEAAADNGGVVTYGYVLMKAWGWGGALQTGLAGGPACCGHLENARSVPVRCLYGLCLMMRGHQRDNQKLLLTGTTYLICTKLIFLAPFTSQKAPLSIKKWISHGAKLTHTVGRQHKCVKAITAAETNIDLTH
eukprot:scaffold7667_cov161-Skeletonema_dohrnii-CCMP3373.AAC.2